MEDSGGSSYIATFMRERTVGFLPQIKAQVGFEPSCYLHYIMEALSYNVKPGPKGVVHLEIGLYEFMMMAPVGDKGVVSASIDILSRERIIDVTYDKDKEIYTISRINPGILSLYGYGGQ